MLKRTLKLPINNSFFLFGPRQVGKTSLIRETFKNKKVLEINLLHSDEYAKYLKQPELLRSELRALSSDVSHIFIDEVQRVPELLNEVQSLMDSLLPQKFILSGSSARKLKRTNANLLGGRALSLSLFPLTYYELENAFNLNEILSFGSLPPVFVESDVNIKRAILKSYLDVYLEQEIKAEALSRNIGGFLRFLTVAAQMSSEQLNYSEISKDIGISSVTVKEYFQILEDTLIGSFLYPFTYSERKSLKIAPKFYLFDIGVVRALQNKLSLNPFETPDDFGKYFENWIINEVKAFSKYYEKDFKLSFLRTKNGAEVDLVIETPKNEIIAVEIKSKKNPEEKDYRAGFEAISRFASKVRYICVCNTHRSRIEKDVSIFNIKDFFEFLDSI